jgi:hypothetical protein
MESKHLKFDVIEEKPKTKVFSVTSKHDLFRLGVIKWFPSWAQYCFFPLPDCVWSEDCLQDLALFLQFLKSERKSEKS